MAEDDATDRVDEDAHTPLVVPSHAPLPLPPEVHYTRPAPDRRSASRQTIPPTGKAEAETEGASGHGAGLAAGFTFVASILAGLLAGTWLDGHFNHSGTPWWTMVMTLAGTGVGFTNLAKLLGRSNRRKP